MAALVTAGWLLHVPALVRGVPGSRSMVLQTAWSIAIAGAALVASAVLAEPRRAQRAAGGALVLIALAVFAEILTGVGVGIDLVPLHAWLDDGNPTPGRMSPNSALCILLAGAALLFAPHAADRRLRMLARVLAGAVAVVGALGLAAHFVGLESVRAWYEMRRLNQMAVPTGVAFVLLGSALTMRGAHTAATSAQANVRTLVLGSALMLGAVAAAAGVAAFIVFERNVKLLVQERLVSLLGNRVRTVESEIAQRLTTAEAIATRPGARASLRRLQRLPNDAEARRVLYEVARSFLPLGFSGVAYESPAGVRWGGAGKFVAAADLAIDLRVAGDVSLLWADRYLLRTRLPITHEGELIGYAVAEQDLPGFAALAGTSEGFGETGEVQLCGLRAGWVHCFPTRSAPHPHRFLPTGESPASRAAAGEEGFLASHDSRNVEVLAAYGPVAALGLAMIVKQDAAEAYAPVRDQLYFTLLILAVLVSAGVGLLWWRVGPLARRIV